MCVIAFSPSALPLALRSHGWERHWVEPPRNVVSSSRSLVSMAEGVGKGTALCYRPRSMLSVSNFLRLSSSGNSASQPYAVATAASSSAWASESHCGRAL